MKWDLWRQRCGFRSESSQKMFLQELRVNAQSGNWGFLTLGHTTLHGIRVRTRRFIRRTDKG
jgi:hypothetical protein